jgi:hypothetical protein
MAKKNNINTIGKWAFIIGLALVIIAGLIEGIYTVPSLALILVILGLIVGFLNINEKDTIKLLLAVIALALTGSATAMVVPAIYTYLQSILENLLVFSGAAALVVAIKAIIEVTKK